jgi:predicted transcriptional regulator
MATTISDLLNLETTVRKPDDAICVKIKNLKGLLDFNTCSSPNWRNTETARPFISVSLKNSRNDSFQSLPQSLSSTPSQPRTPVGRYVSKYKNSEKQVEDKILNTIILSKLNKFSASTYDEIKEFLYQILGSDDDSSTNEFVKEFMNLVFKKAASEEIFCPLYAKLLGEISSSFPIILDEMNKLFENYLEIFKECDETKEENYELFLEKNKEKKYRQGYSQFLAELTSLRILSEDKLIKIFKIISEQIEIQGKCENKTTLNEQYIDCLLRIAKVLRKKTEPFFVSIRSKLYKIVNDTYDNIDSNKNIYKSLSPKSKFLLMDILDYLNGL